MVYQYQVSFVSAVKRAFSQYCCFRGRASRSEYWWFFLFNLLVSSIISCLCSGGDFFTATWDAASGRLESLSTFSSGSMTLPMIWSLIVLLPSWGLFFRRMHDAGHSGWWWLWLLLPLIGWIIVLVALCRNSKPDNKYGAVPNLVNTHTIEP